MSTEVTTSNNREELINQNELLTGEERAILKKYFNDKSHGVSNKETDPLQLLSFGEPPTKLTTNGLWVGNFYDAHSTSILTELRVQSMISLIGQWPNQIIAGIPYLLYPIPQPKEGDKWDDTAKTNVTSIVNMIERLQRTGCTPIFMHCLSGIDRAPTISWKYMVDKLKDSEDDARATVKRLRPISNIHNNWL